MNVTARIASIATLALASLPLLALSTAHAADRVHVSDLNLTTASGKAVFAQRVDHTARNFCVTERNLALKSACEAGVRTEANEKAASNVQFASRN
jgi:UrcA family protein